MKKIILSILFLVHQATSTKVIHRLSDDDYHRMPMKTTVDRFEPCVMRTGGVYCTAHADLVSDEPNELLEMIQGYSADYLNHFNRSNIMYGVCVTRSCSQHYHGNNSQAALQETVEACLNDTISRQHGLKTRVTKLHCIHHGQEEKPDILDDVMKIVLWSFLLLNLAGTLYDVLGDKNKPKNRYLMHFSIRENWRELMAPRSQDPRVQQMRAVNGIKAINCLLVMWGHSTTTTMVAIENPSWFEELLRTPLMHIVNGGNLVVLSFFLLSGFFLTYGKCSEKEVTWRTFPKAILLRWLRLSPMNMLMLLLTVSWFRFSDYGPFWNENIGREVVDCRKYWLHHALYINNFVDNSVCHIQAWWLASDMQLHAVGLFLIHLAPNMKIRNCGLVVMFIASLVIPSYLVYSRDLEATFLNTPSTHSTFFVTNQEFNQLYKRFYCNMGSFAIGMFLGSWVYHKQKENFFDGDYTKYRFLYWMLYPLMLLMPMATYFCFYREGPRAPLLLRVLYAPIIKPMYTVIMALLIIGTMFKIENVYRGFLSWRVWEILTKLSYSMYILHVTLARYHGGTKHVTTFFSFATVNKDFAGLVVLIVTLSMMTYVMVEAPLAGLVKTLFRSSKVTKPKLDDTERKETELKKD